MADTSPSILWQYTVFALWLAKDKFAPIDGLRQELRLRFSERVIRGSG
jgi:hypothetical protein